MARYQKLSSRSHFPISLWAARDELQKHLVDDAESTIVKFRSPDAPPVSELDWTHARDDLSRAMSSTQATRRCMGRSGWSMVIWHDCAVPPNGTLACWKRHVRIFWQRRWC